MAEKENALVVINVLEDSYYNDCRIVGSINIPLRSIERCETEFDKDAEIVVYCSHDLCTEAVEAVKKLKELGFSNVYLFEGGMAAWYQADLPVEGSCMQEYLAHQPTKEEARSTEAISAEALAKKMGFR